MHSRFELVVFDSEDSENHSLFSTTEAKIVGYFSLNSNLEYCDNASQLKYLYHRVDFQEDVYLDLNYKINNVIKKKEFKTWDKLNHLFTWLGLNSSRLFPLNNMPFVTYRGNLCTIMCTPYENKADWTICAKVCNGIIYLNSFETDNAAEQSASASNFVKACQAWGYKFEQYMMTDDPRKKPNVNETLNTSEELCCVFDRKFGDHRIIYGAEMDGICSKNILEENSLIHAEFVELKTNRLIDNYRIDASFRRYKTLKWWCQSYLVNIKYIICGFRDDNGVVKLLKRYSVSDLPSLGNGCWNKDVCLNFCHRFFNFVKQVILENDNGKNDVWKFDYLPPHKISASRITDKSSKYLADFKELKLID